MTSTDVGAGGHSFSAERHWAKFPPDWRIGDVAGVAVDAAGNVYVFNRGDHPMIVVSPAGEVVSSWGSDFFRRPHAVRMTPQGTLLCTDDGDHTVRHCSRDGQVLGVFGSPGHPSPAHSGIPFHRPTDAALAPDGSVFITDGYGNARVHHFSPEGELIRSWGTPGTGPGQFNVPHNLVVDQAGLIYVADRENHRIQVFNQAGAYLGLFGENLHRPSGITWHGGVMYVAEIGPYLTANFGWPGLGPRLSLLGQEGHLVARLEADPPSGAGPGQFVSPHAIAVGPDGVVYLADVVCTGWPSLFPEEPPPADLSGLHRLVPKGEPR
jgi:sugar lactone lactonase YvrE